MLYARRLDWTGFATLFGGALFVFKGIFIIAVGLDLDVTSFALLCLSIGLLGLYEQLRKEESLVTRYGGYMAYVAIAAAAAAVLYFAMLILPLPEPHEATEPAVFQIALGTASLSILSSLILLGVTASRAGLMRESWRVVPLAVGLAWIPLMGLGWVIGDGQSLVLMGLAWMLCGYVLATKKRAPEFRQEAA